MLQAREEYMALPPEERNKFLAQLSEAKGQDWVDAFTSYMETGDLQRFEDAVGATAEFPSGVIAEPGISRETGYERTPDEISQSLAIDRAPAYEVVNTMAQQYIAASDDTKGQMLLALENSKGEEFSEMAHALFTSPDFCEYIARETQNFFDTLAVDFSESNRKGETLAGVADFSETISNGLLDYVSTGRPSNSSILEASVLLAGTALRNFSENGELADALQELSDGALTPGEAAHMAENIEGAVSPEAEEELKDAAASDDIAEGIGVKDMSEDIEDDVAISREKEQNNAMLDAVVEKYKALQTPEAKAQMVEAMKGLFDESLIDYILRRAEGEDFSEDEDETEPVLMEEAEAIQKGDVDNYEELAAELLGAYTSNPTVAKVIASESPVAVTTLPEGAPVAATEGGVSMAEDYQRDDLIDQYDQMGFLN